MKTRLSNFFLLAGSVLFMLFIGSILGKDTNVLYLLSSGIAIFLGFLLRRRSDESESARFTTLRKVNQHARKRREEKKAKNEKKDGQINSPPRGNY